MTNDTYHIAMKTKIIALLLALISFQPLAAGVITLNVPFLANLGADRVQTISVPAGEVFEILTWRSVKVNASGAASPGPTIANDGTLIMDDQWAYYGHRYGSDKFYNSNVPRVVIAGPCDLTFTVPAHFSILMSYQLTPNSGIAPVVQPSNAVVVPSESAGPVQIILESSTDLLNWTPAVPGSYGSSTEKRFFRVRAVQQ